MESKINFRRSITWILIVLMNFTLLWTVLLAVPQTAEAAGSNGIIFINPGHSPSATPSGTSGVNANGKKVTEDYMNEWTAILLGEKLRSMGYTVYLTNKTTLSTDLPAVLTNAPNPKNDFKGTQYQFCDSGSVKGELVPACNNPSSINPNVTVKPDLIISLHRDSNTNSSVRGITTYYSKYSAEGRSAETINRSAYMANVLSSQFSSGLSGYFPNRGVSTTEINSILKYTTAPSILIEGGYMSNATDLANMQKQACQNALVNCIANAVNQFSEKYQLKDSEAPEIGSISIDNGSDIAYNSTVYKNNFTVRLSGVKDNVGVKYVEFNIWRLDGKKHWTYRAVQENPTTWAQWCYVDGPGQYNIDAIAVDYNGNESERIYKTISMVEDTTAPAVGAVEFESSGQYVTETYQTQFTARVWNVKDAVGELDRVQFTVKDESG
ncbi:N-acetylmuramoyl-L-alanine amidase family protein, partial [Christensenella tenuis]